MKPPGCTCVQVTMAAEGGPHGAGVAPQMGSCGAAWRQLLVHLGILLFSNKNIEPGCLRTPTSYDPFPTIQTITRRSPKLFSWFPSRDLPAFLL